jgi:hypothetical protein
MGRIARSFSQTRDASALLGFKWLGYNLAFMRRQKETI